MDQKRRSFLRRVAGVLLAPLGILAGTRVAKPRGYFIRAVFNGKPVGIVTVTEKELEVVMRKFYRGRGEQ